MNMKLTKKSKFDNERDKGRNETSLKDDLYILSRKVC